MEGGIERDVARLVEKQVELYLINLRPLLMSGVECAAVRQDFGDVGEAADPTIPVEIPPDVGGSGVQNARCSGDAEEAVRHEYLQAGER